MNTPWYLTPTMLIGHAGILVTTLVGLRAAIARAPWTSAIRTRVWRVSTALLVGWLAVAVALAYVGFFQGAAARVPTVEIGLLVPILVGVWLLWRSRSVATLLEVVPQSWLVGLQFYRLLGVTFVMLWSAGQLPGLFAEPAGVGDIFIGATAIPVAVAFARHTRYGGTALRLWNILGLLDLVIAVTFGFLTSPSAVQLFSFDAPNELITAYPLVLVPVFAVPLAIVLHLASLKKLARDSAREWAHPGVVTW